MLLLVCTEGEQMGNVMIILVFIEGEQSEGCDYTLCVYWG